jgi:dipeptidyl aminopeptidase/acylaminoacyl peptidase
MKQYIKLVYRFFTVLILGLVTCPASGQDLIQRHLDTNDYKLWSKLITDKISDKAGWISYALRYESHLDTLFIKSTLTGQQYAFAGSLEGKFSSEELFACLDNKQNLQLVNLNKGNVTSISGVKQYEFSSDGSFLITIEFNRNKSMILVIRDKNGRKLQNIENANVFEMNNSGNSLLYSSGKNGYYEAGIINLKQNIIKRKILDNSAAEIKILTWSKDGNTAAFHTENSTNICLYFYDCRSQRLSSLKALPQAFFNNKIITADSSIPLKIADDNSSVFFAYKNAVQNSFQNPVAEIWKNDDKYIYPNLALIQNYNKPLLAVWYPKSKLAHPLSTEKYSWAALTGNQKYAVVADMLQHEPQYDLFAPLDYYIMEVSKGEKELLVSNQTGYTQYMHFSSNGNYICYYKDDIWYLYDIKKKKHTSLTPKTSFSWNSLEDPVNRKKKSFDFFAWSFDGRSLLLYDKYDIWLFFTDGKQPLRLTNGKENLIRYRFAPLRQNKSKFNYSTTKSLVINLKEKNILEAYDTKKGSSGYFILHPEKGLQPLLFADARISNIRKAANRDSYCFEFERFDKSTSLLLKSENAPEIKTVIQTNAQQKNFYWGHSEMIHFENAQKDTLNAALFYPANYNPQIKYPLIVYIYEKLSYKLHNYVIPSIHSTQGFNITHLTSKGYFVLMPDIYYEKGDTGISAVQCVEGAVKNVIEKGIADPSKVGIMGHSFGAYETNIIITKSSMFAAAVSGAGVSDNISGYFTVNSEFNNAEIWRFENQQYRMNGSFYEDKESYLRNSPVFNADKVNTPILIWTGKNDNNVKPEQSTAFFLALRRLNKKSIMLQYPNEGHTLLSLNAQEDLNSKVMEWFDYYLKGEYPKEWLTSSNEKKSNLNP